MAVMIAPAPLDTGTREKELIPDKAIVSARIETVEIRQNKAQDGYYLNIKVETDGACPWPNRWLYGMVSLKDTARWSSNAFMLALGASEEDLAGPLGFYDGSLEDPPETDGFWVEINTLLGDLVDVEVSVETYDGKTNNRIKRFTRNRNAAAQANGQEDMDLPF